MRREDARVEELERRLQGVAVRPEAEAIAELEAELFARSGGAEGRPVPYRNASRNAVGL
ncbi:MAG: hypothetical protein ACREID_03725 [Planctomycetota bacterium]